MLLFQRVGNRGIVTGMRQVSRLGRPAVVNLSTFTLRARPQYTVSLRAVWGVLTFVLSAALVENFFQLHCLTVTTFLSRFVKRTGIVVSSARRRIDVLHERIVRISGTPRL